MNWVALAASLQKDAVAPTAKPIRDAPQAILKRLAAQYWNSQIDK